MITLEEARTFYPEEQCPSDETLRKLIKFFTWAANSEYELLAEEKLDKPPP